MPQNPKQKEGIKSGRNAKNKRKGSNVGVMPENLKYKRKGLNLGAMIENPNQNKGIESGRDAKEPEIK